MVTFIVNLPRYEKSYEFDRNQFMRTFPNSLISNTLELSQDQEINITQPFVTPRIFDILQYYLKNDGLQKIDNELYRSDDAKAGDYLNITILRMISDSKWSDFVTFSSEVRSESDLMEYAVSNDYLSLMEYLIDDLGVNPVTDSQYSPLFIASRKGYMDIFNRLLEDPRVDPSVSNNFVLREAIFFDQPLVVRRLLQDPRVDPRINDNQPLHHALILERETIIPILKEWYITRGYPIPISF